MEDREPAWWHIQACYLSIYLSVCPSIPDDDSLTQQSLLAPTSGQQLWFWFVIFSLPTSYGKIIFFSPERLCWHAPSLEWWPFTGEQTRHLSVSPKGSVCSLSFASIFILQVTHRFQTLLRGLGHAGCTLHGQKWWETWLLHLLEWNN